MIWYLFRMRINEILYKYGFSNFTIRGRGLPIVYTMESYLMYMVKPEFINPIRYELLSRLEK